MSDTALIYAALAVPSLGAVLIALFGRFPNLRETTTLVTAVTLFACVLALAGSVVDGGQPMTPALQITSGLVLQFEIEPLGMLFGLIASGLWILNSIYSIGYMRGHHEPRQTQFYVCFAVSLASTMGIAFAGNLFTLFVFYELLTLVTYPLVTHQGDDKSMRAGRIYIGILVGTSVVLFLTAIIWTFHAAGTLDFQPGGILEGTLSPTATGILLAFFAFGIGKAALMPIHGWLPTAMVAPTPVSALLHAVAVVKAGVFSVVKIVVYVFGIENLSATGANDWLVFVASFSLVLASLIALTKDNLKARLAYSTVSQLAYVVLGASLATSAAIVGSGMHIAMHAAGKITLFFCAGAIMVAAHKSEISEMAGLGRRMPITMCAFLIGSLSIIGLPPFGGTWSKWWLAIGAAEAEHLFVIGVLMVSSLLNVAYLLPVVARGFFLPPPEGEAGSGAKIQEAPIACLVPLSLTALTCLVLFFQADEIVKLLSPIVAAPS